MTPRQTPEQSVQSPVKRTGPVSAQVPALVVLYAICQISVLIPVLTAAVYPMTDYPVHLMLLDAAASRDPAFTTNWFTPYSLSVAAGRIITLATSAITAGKCLLLVYFIGTPAAFALLILSMRRPFAYAFVIFPLLYNFNVSWGFLPFLVSIPFFLAALAACVHWLRTERTLYLSACAGLMILVFFCHLFTWIITSVALGGLVLMAGNSVYQRIKGVVWLLMPSTLLAAAWYRSLAFNAADQTFLSKGIRFPSMSLKFRFFPDYVMSGHAGIKGVVLFYLLGILMILLAAAAWRVTGPRSVDRFNRALFWIPASFLLMYLVCPYSLLTAVWLYNRIAWLVMAMLITVVIPCTWKPVTIGFALAATVITGGQAVETTQTYMSFQQEAAGAIQCLAALPQGQTLRYLPLTTRSQFTDHTPYDHMDAYYAVFAGGDVHNPFAVLTHMPVKYSPGKMAFAARFQPGVRRSGDQLVFDPQTDHYRFFLVRGRDGSPGPALPAIFHDALPRLALRCEHGEWLVLEHRHHLPDGGRPGAP